jgi:hypothetical protein
MSSEQPPPQEEQRPEPLPTMSVVSAAGAFRVLLVLLAVWTAFSGLSLAVFQGVNAATLAGGLDDEAAQRLLGVHLLALVPVYLVLAWRPQQHRFLLWLPYAVQAGVVVATAYDVIAGNRDLQDGALPLIVAGIFLALLVYVWAMQRQAQVPAKAKEPAGAAEKPPERES